MWLVYTRCINSVLLFELVLIREFAESFENQTSRVEIEGRLRRVFQYRVLGGCADFFVNAGTVTLHVGNFVAAGDTYYFFVKFMEGQRFGAVWWNALLCFTTFISSKPPSS